MKKRHAPGHTPSPIAPVGGDWRPYIERVFAALGAPVPGDETCSRLRQLLDLVIVWNARVDLTAARTPDELTDLYLADAVVLSRIAPWGPGYLALDVGSGGGAPGLTLATLLPEVSFRLVEPREKRVAFLRTAAGTLGLNNVEVVRARSEELAARSCDVALSRATLGPTEWLAEGARLATRAVWVLLARSAPPLQAGWSAEVDEPYAWPFSGAPRRAVRYAPSAPVENEPVA